MIIPIYYSGFLPSELRVVSVVRQTKHDWKYLSVYIYQLLLLNIIFAIRNIYRNTRNHEQITSSRNFTFIACMY